MSSLVRRTHHCGALRATDVGQEVILHGWVDSCRDHHHFVFIDLRDRWGITQVYFGEDQKELMEAAARVKPESVLAVRGTVRPRPDDMVNPDRPTGQVEVLAAGFDVLNDCKTPPFPISELQKPSEEMRLRYRYLDLRRPAMQRNLLFRHRFFSAVRRSLDAMEFVDVETPMLTRAMPEGARDYVVPSRVSPGSFFALPQSPQLFKQILMVSGYDRYYQIARCLRDEDLRADRQPEFTQLDLEMSFVNEDDVFDVVESAVASAVEETTGTAVPRPFPRLTHTQAMLEFGSEKPDLRNSLRIQDVSEAAAASGFRVFSGAVSSGGVVRVLRVPGGSELSRRVIEKELEVRAKEMGAKGLAWTKIKDSGEPEGGIGRFLGDDAGKQILEQVGAAPGDALFFGADREPVACAALSEVHRMLGERFGGVDPKAFAFSWVVDFPLFEWSEDDKQWYPAQHAFTTPREEYDGHLEEDPGSVKARAYDLVLNGWELGSGGIRIHHRDLQQRVFDVLGISVEEARQRFGFLLEAFEYGAPPHGGIGIGLDRLVALVLGEDNIREVIPFPKTASAACLMTGAPSPIEDIQLEELKISVEVPADESPEADD